MQRVRDWLIDNQIKPVIPHKDNEKARWDGRVKFDRAGRRVNVEPVDAAVA